MSSGYWQRTLSERLTRRRTLVVSGVLAAGGAFLAACGGSSDGAKSTGPKDTSGLLSEPVDTTKQARRGGVLKRNGTSPPSLDPLQQTGAVPLYETVVGRLVGFKPGFMTPPGEGDVDGDLCNSWEFSPDRLQITLRMRPGVKWHNVAPVNGRDVDVDDVLYTWERFSAIGAQRTAL